MATKPLVSIIINNYNYGSFLGEAIDSALAQTYSDIEVIVVDDGSKDRSRQVIAEYEDRVISILKKNGGQASAVNAGFKVSHGEFVILLDSDDYLMPTCVESFIDKFEHEKVVKVHWPLLKVDKAGNATGEVLPEESLIEGNLREQVIDYGPAHCGGPPQSPPTSGNAWARWFLDQVIPIPELQFRDAIDMYLFTLAPLFGEIKSIAHPQGYYRVHGDNNTLHPAYLKNFFDRFDDCSLVLIQYLAKEGIVKGMSDWPKDHWFHKVDESLNDITENIPENSSFILVDENFWLAGKDISNRHRYFFSEKNGEYWGIPADDMEAIRELESRREEGASYIVFAWSSFWWLDHFSSLRKHLYSNYTPVLENERVIIFKLIREPVTIVD